MKTKLIQLIASGLGLGYIPMAPGTFGTLWGGLIFFLCHAEMQNFLIVITLILTMLSIVIADLAEKSFGEKDSQKIVIDEVVGCLVTYCFVPYSLINLILGFVLFRLFDILKIFPARLAGEKLNGGFGVVADDIVAGLQGGIVLYLFNIYLQ